MKNIIKGVNLIFFNPSFKVYGVDTLRLWVAAHASQSSSILIGDGILGQTKQDLDRLRNAFKFLLGNISRMESRSQLLEVPEDLRPLDVFALQKAVPVSYYTSPSPRDS